MNGDDEEEEERPPFVQQAQQQQPAAREELPPFVTKGQEPEAESAIGAFTRPLAHEVLPMAVGAAGMAAAPIAGRIIGGAAGTLLGGPAGTIAGGVLGGMAASYLQEKALNYLGYDDSHQQAVNAATHPIATTAGRIAGVLPFFGAGAAPAAVRAGGAALTGGIEAAGQLYRGEFDPYALAEAAGTGAVLTRPTALTRGIEAGVAGAAARLGVKAGRPEYPGKVAPEAAADEAAVTPSPNVTVARGVAKEAIPPGDEPIGDPQNKAAIGETAGAREAGGEKLTTVEYGKARTEPAPAAVRKEEVAPAPEPRVVEPAPAPAPAPREGPAVDPAIEQAATIRAAQEDPLALQQQEAARRAAPAPTPAPAAPTAPPGLERLAQRYPGVARYLEGPYREQAAMARQQPPLQQQQEQPRLPMAAERVGVAGEQPPAAAAPPAAPPPEPPRPPPRAPRGAPVGGNPDATRAAMNLDDELHKLTTIPAADAVDYVNRADEAAKLHPEVAGKGGERIYKAIEEGKLDQLPKKMREAYDQATAEKIKEADAIRDELIKRKKIADEPADPNYAHRVLKSQPIATADPTTTGRLPGMYDPSSAKSLAFRGAQAKDGSRLTIADGDTSIPIFRDRKIVAHAEKPVAGEDLKTGDKFTYQGKEYTIDRGRTAEIERDATHADGTPVEYHKNAFLSAFDYHRQMTMMKRYHDLMDRIKDPINSPIADFMTRSNNEATMRGWKESEIPDMKGIYLHPDLEQVLHNNYNPGIGAGPQLDWLRAMNQFAVRSIFWNPVPHSMNALMHYVVARGWDWLPMPRNRYGMNWTKSVIEGFKSAITQDELLQDLNRSGTSLIMSKIDSQRFAENLGYVLNTDLKNNPRPWEQFARDWSLGRGVDAVNLIYNSAQRALWTFSDALMASRVRELEMNNPSITREQAIAQARIHMPDYRLPIKMFGSQTLVRAMSDQRLAMFGRYHMGVFNSLGRMTMDLFKGTPEQRKEALGNVFAVAALGFIVKPILDGLVQSITGTKEAETRPRGPLGPLTSAYEVAEGKKDMGQALSNIFTFSPGIKAITQLLSNRDFAGREIVQTGAPLYMKPVHLGEYAAGNLISPYGTFGPTVQPGTAKGSALHEFLSQIFDVKVPTPRQVKGAKYGETMRKKEAKAREKKPRGLIEYGATELKKAVGLAEGGPVPPGYARGGPVLQQAGQRRYGGRPASKSSVPGRDSPLPPFVSPTGF